MGKSHGMRFFRKTFLPLMLSPCIARLAGLPPLNQFVDLRRSLPEPPNVARATRHLFGGSYPHLAHAPLDWGGGQMFKRFRGYRFLILSLSWLLFAANGRAQ